LRGLADATLLSRFFVATLAVSLRQFRRRKLPQQNKGVLHFFAAFRRQG
jgi:hypothetical protein